MKLVTENLSWHARRTPIVQDVSLTVEPGQMVGLIGPNGSGKSTLMRLIAGIRRPASGQIFLDGRPMAAMSRRDVAQRVALVEQQADSAEPIQVRDAVELGRTPWLSPISSWSDQDTAIVDRALADVDMTAFTDRFWHTLSGGERQRVHIARALAQEPGLLLLDEPTNHLDIRHQMSILDLIARLKVTTVIALHDLNHAMICDRIGVMQGGRLIHFGAPAEIMTPGLLREIFGVCAHPLTDPTDGSTVLRFHRFTDSVHG